MSMTPRAIEGGCGLASRASSRATSRAAAFASRRSPAAKSRAAMSAAGVLCEGGGMPPT